MTKKVIYVSYMRLSDKVSRDWYIDYLIENGINVEYWDVVALLRGEFDEPGTKTTDYLRTFQAYSEVEAMLCLPENRGAFYVMLVSYDGHTARIFRLLSKHNCRMLFLSWGASPIRRIQKLNKVLFNIFRPWWLAKKVFYKLKAIVYRKLKLVKPFTIIFAAGQIMATMKNHFAAKLVSVNIPDFDQYKKAGLAVGRIVDARYAVFLDVYLPYHSDIKLIDGASVNPDDYYASLNRFFELLEVKCGVKVVIAAHPRADYRVNPFHGRDVYCGLTPELVKDSDFVITHQSTSLSYAILNLKPVIFIYTNEIATKCQHTIMSYLYAYSGYLDAAIYNIDKITQGDQIVIREANLKSYDDYKYNYLTTHESENTTTQEIFLREIRQCH